LREADGSWIIPADHLERAEAYERECLRDRPVCVTLLSSRSLDELTSTNGATWLDFNLTGDGPATRDARFGSELRQAEQRRRLWLIEQGFAEERDGRTLYRPTMLRELRAREISRVGDQLSAELGLAFRKIEAGDAVAGIYRRPIDLAGARIALIEDGPQFTLVPWRPILERQLGKHVSGILRREGISWTLGRERSGPAR
jgi:hypothetical protein